MGRRPPARLIASHVHKLQRDSFRRLLVKTRLVLKKLLENCLSLLIQSVRPGSRVPCHRDKPSPVNQVVERSTYRLHISFDPLSTQPPFSDPLRRIFRVRIGTEVAENQPSHDIVMLREIWPAHGRVNEQLQYRICRTRKYVLFRETGDSPILSCGRISSG